MTDRPGTVEESAVGVNGCDDREAGPGELAEMEATYHRAVRYAADTLWARGAVEETLAALYDLMTETPST